MAQSFNEMAHSVGERLKLLPFVSQFTADAVEKSRYVDHWLEGQQREAAILMTDVRGFTSSAADMAAPELLSKLNQLLALQSEVVEKHDGAVDKFMGDAVLAVFSGKEDNLARAVRCGRELFSRVQRQTHDGPICAERRSSGCCCSRSPTGSPCLKIYRSFSRRKSG